MRKEGDSNPRTGFAGYTLSRRASSATRAPFLYTEESRYHITLQRTCYNEVQKYGFSFEIPYFSLFFMFL